MNSLMETRAFAIEAHGSQMYGDRPYSEHLDAVAAICAQYGEAAIELAYLHDVVEDTPVTLDDIAKRFGFWTARNLEVLTDGPGTRRERKARSNEKLTRSSGLPLIVKAADRLANMRSGAKLDMYLLEYPAFREAAYRPGLCDRIWTELDKIFAENCTPYQPSVKGFNSSVQNNFSTRRLRRAKAAPYQVDGKFYHPNGVPFVDPKTGQFLLPSGLPEPVDYD